MVRKDSTLRTVWAVSSEKREASVQNSTLPPSRSFIGSRLRSPKKREAPIKSARYSFSSEEKGSRSANSRRFESGPAIATAASFLYELNSPLIISDAPKMSSRRRDSSTPTARATAICASSWINAAPSAASDRYECVRKSEIIISRPKSDMLRRVFVFFCMFHLP